MSANAAYLPVPCTDCRTPIDDLDEAWAGLLCERCARRSNPNVCQRCKGHGTLWRNGRDLGGRRIRIKDMCIPCAGSGMRRAV